MLLGSTVLAGCPGEDPAPAPPPPGSGSLALTQLKSEQLRAVCGALFRCEIHEPLAVRLKLVLRDEARCRSVLERAGSDGGLDDLLRAVNQGTIVYDGAAAKACLLAYSQDCSLFGDDAAVSQSCDGVFTGQVATGGACRRSEECAGDAFCAARTSTAGDCPATCQPRLPLGRGCQASDQCTHAGLMGVPACLVETGTRSVCRDQHRVGAVGEGMTCGLDEASGREVPCQSALYCDRVTHRCRPRAASGAPCTGGVECQTLDEVCLRQPGARDDTCGMVTIQGQAGQPCNGSTIHCDPLAGLVCEANTTCRPGPATGGPRGALCAAGDPLSPPCDPGLYCKPGQGTASCELQAELGQACDRGAACKDSFCVQGTCRARDCRAL